MSEMADVLAGHGTSVYNGILGGFGCECGYAFSQELPRSHHAELAAHLAAALSAAGFGPVGNVLNRMPRYRALLSDGSLWIETKSLGELKERCEGKEVTIQYLEVLTVETPWKPYRKDT